MNPDRIRNLGPVSLAWLEEVGIESLEALREVGALPTYRLIRGLHPKASLNLLWALHAATFNRDWRDLSEEEKAALIDELDLDLL